MAPIECLIVFYFKHCLLSDNFMTLSAMLDSRSAMAPMNSTYWFHAIHRTLGDEHAPFSYLHIGQFSISLFQNTESKSTTDVITHTSPPSTSAISSIEMHPADWPRAHNGVGQRCCGFKGADEVHRNSCGESANIYLQSCRLQTCTSLKRWIIHATLVYLHHAELFMLHAAAGQRLWICTIKESTFSLHSTSHSFLQTPFSLPYIQQQPGGQAIGDLSITQALGMARDQVRVIDIFRSILLELTHCNCYYTNTFTFTLSSSSCGR